MGSKSILPSTQNIKNGHQFILFRWLIILLLIQACKKRKDQHAIFNDLIFMKSMYGSWFMAAAAGSVPRDQTKYGLPANQTSLPVIYM